MKAFLSLLAIGMLLFVGSVTVGEGQSTPQPMFTVQLVEDHTCNATTSACQWSDAGDCVVSDLLGVVDNCAYLYVKIICNPSHSNCGGCFACAFVIRNTDGALVATNSSTCTNCSPSKIQFEMQNNVHYTVFSCLRSCDGNCDHCSADCYAVAYVDLN
jgi:hypothetical protein